MTTQTTAPAESTAATSVRARGATLGEVRFAFHEEASEGQTFWARLRGAALAHVVFIGAVLLVGALVPERVYQAVLPEQLSDQIVWLNDPGPGGGGGGGGNRMQDPPRAAELPGQDRITAPVVKPPTPTPEPPKPEEITAEDLPNVPIQTMASADTTNAGLIAPTASPSTSQGTGTGGGAGSGTGSGIGSGQGSGLGPGFGGGTGGGAYQPGNGVTSPVPIREVKPQYTAEAMRAKVQGEVWLQCIVNPDGTVGSVQVTKSLDATFGLDQEAIKAARQWRFRPGMRQGEPVPVLITIALTFSLR